jgi:hypothetical protein
MSQGSPPICGDTHHIAFSCEKRLEIGPQRGVILYK